MAADRYIERSFPIVQLNPLSVRERNAFKPVYKMHKWFARRSSSIFRAILLGAALPYEDENGQAIDLMAEFYKGHVDDPRLRRPDGTPLRVLDPFMGGGTTVVEALRLGFEVTGIDYNPIAWFIVRGETTPVDLAALDAAYQRVAAKVKDELLALYKTRCPLTGKDADIIYGFWVKQGICVDPTCGKATDLFKSYEVARKRGDVTLRYKPDVVCPHCRDIFDWELDRCTITAGGPQIEGERPAGKGRPEKRRYAFGLEDEGVTCPLCGANIKPHNLPSIPTKTKTVPLHVLVDPSSGDFFEVRGGVPVNVTAVRTGYSFNPEQGPVEGGKFRCAHCGRKQDIVQSAKALGRSLPFRYFGFYAYAPCVSAPENYKAALRAGLPTNNNKWFAAVTADDLRRVTDASIELDRAADNLPIPTQEICDGYNTNRLVIHQYRRWCDLYSPRQLLALGKLLRAIGEEPDQKLRDLLLAAFKVSLGCMSNLALYNVALTKVERVNSAHDYRNPTTTAEANVWGLKHGRGSFSNAFEQVKEGADPQRSEWEWRKRDDGEIESFSIGLPSAHGVPKLLRASSTSIEVESKVIDLVVTDPPYAGSVQYAEMADWYYVWLHQVLKDHYPDEFAPEITLKSEEIIEDGRNKDAHFFFENLTKAWRECHRVLKDDGLLVFTFHHKEGDRWTGLLKSLFDAGFYLVAAYPTHSEALNSIVIQATKGITYDIVHVCRKRLGEPEAIPWTRLRREVQREARAQLKELEQGKDVLPGPDVWMILLGKALKLFSQHYGKVLDADGQPLDLDEAMERISLLVREIRGEELPLPAALQNIDSLSQVALLHVIGAKSWTRDGLHIELRGYAHGPERLIEAQLVREVKGQKGRLESVPPLERYAAHKDHLDRRRDGLLIDKLHLLLGMVQEGRPIDAQMKSWRGRWSEITEALAWLAKADPAVRDLAGLTLRAIEALGPDTPIPTGQQLKLLDT